MLQKKDKRSTVRIPRGERTQVPEGPGRRGSTQSKNTTKSTTKGLTRTPMTVYSRHKIFDADTNSRSKTATQLVTLRDLVPYLLPEKPPPPRSY